VCVGGGGGGVDGCGENYEVWFYVHIKCCACDVQVTVHRNKFLQ